MNYIRVLCCWDETELKLKLKLSCWVFIYIQTWQNSSVHAEYNKECQFVFSMAENHRTQTKYDDALIFKLFAFQFVNSYASCFYIAFFRGVCQLSFSGVGASIDHKFLCVLRVFTSSIMWRLGWNIAVPLLFLHLNLLFEELLVPSPVGFDSRAAELDIRPSWLYFFPVVDNFNTLKTVELLVHARLFGCLGNPHGLQYWIFNMHIHTASPPCFGAGHNSSMKVKQT